MTVPKTLLRCVRFHRCRRYALLPILNERFKGYEHEESVLLWITDNGTVIKIRDTELIRHCKGTAQTDNQKKCTLVSKNYPIVPTVSGVIFFKLERQVIGRDYVADEADSPSIDKLHRIFSCTPSTKAKRTLYIVCEGHLISHNYRRNIYIFLSFIAWAGEVDLPLFQDTNSYESALQSRPCCLLRWYLISHGVNGAHNGRS